MSVSSTEDSEWSVETLYKTSGDDKGDWGLNPLDSKDLDSESQTTLSFWDEDDQTGLFRRWWKTVQSRLPTGWHFGAWIAAVQAGIVLLINLVVAIWTAVKVGGGSSGIIFQGDCNTVNRLTIGIHLVINVLGTLLLGASNYVMQSLCAPTRSEVDKAHENGSWLDIGLQSVRNLKYASRWKRVLWICLCVSSVPLHLFYNSSVFSALGANEYTALLASGPDVQLIPVNGSYNWKLSGTFPISYEDEWDISEWEFLDASACLRAYATDFVTDRGDMLVITGSITNGTVIPTAVVTVSGGDIAGSPGPFGWICSSMELPGVKTCTDVWTSIDPSSWTILGDIPVHYCISQPIEAECQLESNLPLLAVVIIFNAAKVLCMVIVTTRMKDHPLVTVGDAIASFIQDPDLNTRGMCLVSESLFLDQPEGQSQYVIPEPIEYQPRRVRWMGAATPQHWTITILLSVKFTSLGFIEVLAYGSSMNSFISAIAIVLGLLGFAVDRLAEIYDETGFSALWQFGLGKTHAENIIQGWKIPSRGYGALLATVLISNSPQLILSMIYILFNGLCTKLFLSLEWSAYARTRKPLRVSYPRGGQRSTYFLQIPYRFSLPLLVYSALLHWLVSQSIFLVKVNFWPNSGNSQELDTEASITSCGFSPAGMILTSIVAGSLMLIALVFGYFRHLNGDMPMAGSCSAAIAAACHAPKGDSGLKPVKWGVVSDQGVNEEDVGHVSFSSGVVKKPIIGHRYA